MSEKSPEEIEEDVEALLGELNEYDDLDEMLEDIVDDPDCIGDAETFTRAFENSDD